MIKRTVSLGLVVAMTGIAMIGCNEQTKTEDKEPVVTYTYQTETETKEEFTTPEVLGDSIGYSPAMYMPVRVKKVTMNKTITEVTTVTPVKDTDGEKEVMFDDAEVNETVLTEEVVKEYRQNWIVPKGYDGFPNGYQYDQN